MPKQNHHLHLPTLEKLKHQLPGCGEDGQPWWWRRKYEPGWLFPHFQMCHRFEEVGEEEKQGSGVWGESSVGMEKKRVMVVVDQSGKAKEAMMWALTRVANKGDLLTLLHVLPACRGGDSELHNFSDSLASLCKSCKHEVEVEVLVMEGPKLETVLSQVRKLEASVLVLSQSKPSLCCCLFNTNSEDFVEQCINEAQCLTLAVRKQSMGVGGYLVSTRWHKNFWLLA